MSWAACAAAVRGEATVDEVGETLSLLHHGEHAAEPRRGAVNARSQSRLTGAAKSQSKKPTS